MLPTSQLRYRIAAADAYECRSFLWSGASKKLSYGWVHNWLKITNNSYFLFLLLRRVSRAQFLRKSN